MTLPGNGLRPFLAARFSWSGGCDALAPTRVHATSTLPDAHATHAAAAGGDLAVSLASRRRFCAMAASVHSSRAPRGPRNRRRPSRRMRFKWANSISTRLRSRHDCSKASVSASARATSRASSCTSRVIFRHGVFGQHLGFKRAGFAITLEGEVAKRVVGADGPGRGQQLSLRAHINIAFLVEAEVVSAPGSRSLRLDLSITGMCGAIPFSLTSQLRFAADP